MPDLRGDAFDRGPTICDMPHPIWATLNIPNTFVRMGDWKLYRFWYDRSTALTASNPVGIEHRYELYNVREDIGAKHDLAGEDPDRVAPMDAVLDRYYQESGVLGYHPNSEYNQRTVGTWFAASDDGTIAAHDGALVLKSESPGYTVKNRFFPPGGREGWLAFEARSSTGTPLTVAGPGKGRTIALSQEWQSFELPGKQVFIDRNKFAARLPDAGEAELRNVRILTPDKTEMMRYTFY